jgi:hypothetical protein
MTVKPSGDDVGTVIVAGALAAVLATALWARTSRAPSPEAQAAAQSA